MTHPRTRIAAAVGAVALIGFSVFGAVTAASAAPATPVITTPASSGVTMNPALTVSGTVDNPLDDHLIVEVDAVVNGTPQIFCQADVPTGTAWTCEDTLAEGTNVLSAMAWVFGDETDAGAAGNAITVTLGGTEPTTIDEVPEGTDKRPVFSGTGPAMGAVSVEDGSPVCEGSVPVDAHGDWSCQPDFDMTAGFHLVQAHGTLADSTPDPNTASTGVVIDPGKPTMAYSFGPASITATATGDPDLGTAIELYQISSDGEGGYTFGEPVAGCPTPNGSIEPHRLNYGAPVETCSFGSLVPGIWNVYSGQGAEESAPSPDENDFVLIPATPTIATHVNANRSVAISGGGTAGDLVTVQNPSGGTVCGTDVSSSGLWSCTVSPGTGTNSYRAIELSRGFAPNPSNSVVDAAYNGYSAYSGVVTAVVPAPPQTPQTPQTPSVPAITYTVDFTSTSDTVTPGDTVTFTGSGPPGATADGEIHSTPVDLGSTVIGPDGTFTLVAVVPKDIEPGLHHFVITVTSPGQTPVVVERPVTVKPLPVVGAGKQTPGSPDHSGHLDTAHRGLAVGVDRNDPAAPNAMSHALPTLQSLLKNPVVIGVAAAGGLALLLFVAFPAELLNSTLSENYERLFGRIPRVRMPWLARLKARLARAPVTGGLAVTAIAAIIFGFADPHFGFDLVSLRLVLACGIALFVVGYVANAITGLIVRKRWAVGTAMELKPLGLVLSLVGVVLSRLIDFSPGFLIGLILGISLTGTTTEKQRSRTVLIRSGIVLGFGVIAWFVSSALAAGGEPDSFLSALASDTMAGIVTEGLTALVIGLLPFRYLEGEEVFAESRRIWAIGYLVAIVAFCVFVLPSQENWEKLGSSLWIWTVVVIVFAAVCIGLYVFFRTRFREDEEEREEISVAD